MKRKRIARMRIIVLSNLAWFAVASMLLFAVQGMNQRLLSKKSTIKYLAQEISWQRYAADKARSKVASVPRLQYMTSIMETRDPDFHAIAKASWKWGKRFDVSPYLIMAVAHRESAFDPLARSYDRNGSPLAYGVMQINYRVWKDQLALDISKMHDVDYNVEKGTQILKYYLDQHAGDVSAALFGYWGGSLANGRYTYPPRVLESKYFTVENNPVPPDIVYTPNVVSQ